MISRKNAFDNYMEEVNSIMKGGYGGGMIRTSSREDLYSTVKSKESLNPISAKNVD